MSEQPHEVQALRQIHPHLLLATYAALEQALESTPHPSHEDLESIYRATLGHQMRLCMHNELSNRLGGEVQWYSDRGFVAMVPRGLGIAVRFGRCDQHGRPNDIREREEGAPFRDFQEGTALMYNDSELTPIFGGYSLLRRGAQEPDVEVDRFILAKYTNLEHEWSWGLDPSAQGPIRSAREGVEGSFEVMATQVPIPRQRRLPG